MTVGEVLSFTKSVVQRSASFADDVLSRFLYELDLKTHESFLSDYTECPQMWSFDGDVTEQELLIPEPYTGVYVHYLAKMVDIHNGDTRRAADDIALFNDAYTEYKREYNNKHERKTYQIKNVW